MKVIQDKDALRVIQSHKSQLWHYVYKLESTVGHNHYWSICGKWMYSSVLHNLGSLGAPYPTCATCHQIYNYNFTDDSNTSLF